MTTDIFKGYTVNDFINNVLHRRPSGQGFFKMNDTKEYCIYCNGKIVTDQLNLSTLLAIIDKVEIRGNIKYLNFTLYIKRK